MIREVVGMWGKNGSERDDLESSKTKP